eukprot:645691-Pyramimonas_sp.AAC.1
MACNPMLLQRGFALDDGEHLVGLARLARGIVGLGLDASEEKALPAALLTRSMAGLSDTPLCRPAPPGAALPARENCAAAWQRMGAMLAIVQHLNQHDERLDVDAMPMPLSRSLQRWLPKLFRDFAKVPKSAHKRPETSQHVAEKFKQITRHVCRSAQKGPKVRTYTEQFAKVPNSV